MCLRTLGTSSSPSACNNMLTANRTSRGVHQAPNSPTAHFLAPKQHSYASPLHRDRSTHIICKHRNGDMLCPGDQYLCTRRRLPAPLETDKHDDVRPILHWLPWLDPGIHQLAQLLEHCAICMSVEISCGKSNWNAVWVRERT